MQDTKPEISCPAHPTTPAYSPPYTKLKWRCRRGTRELDLLLLNYLKNKFQTADQAQQYQFYQLLEWQDSELIACLLENKPVPNEELSQLVAQIRTHSGI
jgi:antitoxin CptB